MERDEVMGMAALAVQDTEKDCRDGAIVPFVLRFAALIEAAATEKANERANASWSSMCEKMVAAEREACARVCESESEVYAAYAQAEKAKLTAECAALIRARGNLK